jgi:hypothetical protein
MLELTLFSNLGYVIALLDILASDAKLYGVADDTMSNK